jgi:DNA polymerase III sliding clamp (beta) subunit (PCNA family)
MIFNNNTVTMTKAEAKAMIEFASEDETRPNLNSIKFEDRGVVVATDGYRIVVHASQEEPQGCNFGEKLVAREVLEKAVKLTKKGLIEIRFSVDDEVRIDAGGSVFSTEAVDAQYPPYQAVFKSADEKTVQTVGEVGINAAYFEAMELVQSAAEVPTMEVKISDPLDPIDIWVGTQWRALVMPARV